jgi:sarcosine oxidase subunit beta
MYDQVASNQVPLPQTADVVIIGAGIVGIATAFHLARHGIDAVVLDAAPDIGSRTTAMSAHCIRAQFSEPDNIAMMAESLTFYENFAQECGTDQADISLRQQGYLFASTDHADTPEFAARVAEQHRAELTDVELFTGAEVRTRYPWLSEEIAVATYRARDGWIDSARAVQAMAVSARLRLCLNVEVTHINVEAGRVNGIRSPTGDIQTRTVILAAGPFSGILSPEPLPIQLLRRHRVIVAPNPAIPQEGPVTIDANTGSHWRPHRGGALAAWAQPEPDSDPVWPVPADLGFTDLILRGDGGIARLAPIWNAIVPTLNPSDITLTAGQYTVTPDHRPLIGPAPQTEGLYLHTGYSGHGIMGAPAGARLLADLISSSNRVPNPFSPSRFEGAYTPPDVERVII